jgi:hypothetical protein
MSLHKVTPSLRWSTDNAPLPSQVLTSALGLAAPIIFGTLTGHLAAGLTAGFGGLAMGGAAQPHVGLREQVTSLFWGLLAGTAAIELGAWLGGYGVEALYILPLVVFVVALLSSSSRTMARLCTLFNVFLLIASGLGAQHGGLGHIVSMFGLGGLWAALLSLVLTPLCRRAGFEATPAASSQARPGFQRLREHWLKSLRTFAGWQYALRLLCAMLPGALIGATLVHGHAYWILLTIVLVLDRQLPASSRKTFDRAAGTVIGVALASALTVWVPPLGLVIALIAVLAAIRPVLKSANYLAYSAIMTPLIILLMDLGPDSDLAALGTTLRDRLIATLIACALVLLLDKLLWHRFAVPPSQKA